VQCCVSPEMRIAKASCANGARALRSAEWRTQLRLRIPVLLQGEELGHNGARLRGGARQGLVLSERSLNSESISRYSVERTGTLGTGWCRAMSDKAKRLASDEDLDAEEEPLPAKARAQPADSLAIFN
jgi:hypothetical protein